MLCIEAIKISLNKNSFYNSKYFQIVLKRYDKKL